MSLFVDIEKTLGAFHLQVKLTAEHGTTGILGASGCGKSMTLRCIAGVETPDRGIIRLNGKTLFDSTRGIDLPPQQRHVGFLFQNYALFPNMTVRQNILTGLCREKDKEKRRQRCDDMLHFLQLAELADHRPSALSGGQQQRTALARILVGDPEILLLDEPFSALDAHLRSKLQVEMKALLSHFDGPSLMVTHDRGEAYKLSDTIAIMDDGSILAHKPIKVLFADPETVAAARITGCKNIARAIRIDEHTLEAPDWGMRFTTALPIREGLTAVGIRAHYFNQRTAENRQTVKIQAIMEEPFEDSIQFRYDGQAVHSPDLWWRIPKEYRPESDTLTLGVAPINVLPLYD